LRALLYQKTEYGQRLEAQQLALHKFNREAKKAGQVSPELLLKHILANRTDLSIVDSLASAATPALNYQFFMLLSEKIEKREKSGVDANELVALRAHLLAVQQSMEEQSRQLMDQAMQTLQTVLSADDLHQAVHDNLSRIDDGFMYVLRASIAQAEERGEEEQAQALVAIYDAIRAELDSQMPPEIQLLNQIMTLESDEERRQLLDDEPEMSSPEFLELVEAVAEQAEEGGRQELAEQLNALKAMIAARLSI